MNRFILLVFFILVSTASVVAAEPVIEIQAIAGKSPEEVGMHLGKPSGQDKTKRGPKLSYKGGEIEVVFIAGKADWITISSMSKIPFDTKAIEAFGLKSEVPSFKNDSVIRWEPHTLYRSIAVFPLGNGKVDYAYIKVSTE